MQTYTPIINVPCKNKGKEYEEKNVYCNNRLDGRNALCGDAGPKDDVAAAASKLADGGNYSWKSTMDLGPNSQFTPGPTEGKIDKDGTIWLSMTFNDNTIEGAKMGDKVAVKGEDGWQAGSEITADAGAADATRPQGWRAACKVSRRPRLKFRI